MTERDSESDPGSGVDGPGEDPDPADVRVLAGDALTGRTGAGGLVRETAFDCGETLLVRTRLPPGFESGWHHHGRRGTYAYVAEGRIRLAFGTDSGGDGDGDADGDGDVDDDEGAEGDGDGAPAVEAGAGDFLRAPPGLVHRESNAGDGEAVVLAAFVGPGPATVDADGPPTDPHASTPPASLPEVATPGEFVESTPLPNLVRKTPFPDADVHQVRGHADGRVVSGWHHHGDNDVFGYVLGGEGHVEYGTGEGQRRLASAGDFFVVPAGLVHRDVNPGDAEQDYVLWMVGSEPRTVRVDGPG